MFSTNPGAADPISRALDATQIEWQASFVPHLDQSNEVFISTTRPLSGEEQEEIRGLGRRYTPGVIYHFRVESPDWPMDRHCDD